MSKSLTPRGAFPAPSIPLNDDYSLNEAEFARHIEDIASQQGISGVVVNGHAGELLELSGPERSRVIQIARQNVPSGKLVIAGLEDHLTAGAIDRLKEAEDAGADAVLVMPPFDSLLMKKLTSSWEPAYRYFSAIAAASKLPFIVFEYPKYTGLNYTTDTLERLAEIDNVVAIKDTVSDDQLYQEHLEVLSGKVSILTAIDSPALLGYMLLGSDGIILGASQLAPAAWGEYVDHILAGRQAEAIEVFKARLLPIVSHIYEGRFDTFASHNARIKEALRMTGVFTSARVRPPELDVTDSDREHIRAGLELASLIPAAVK
jgi:4-hydroxy-tetrahydrodipicolinate synthase